MYHIRALANAYTRTGAREHTHEQEGERSYGEDSEGGRWCHCARLRMYAKRSALHACERAYRTGGALEDSRERRRRGGGSIILCTCTLARILRARRQTKGVLEVGIPTHRKGTKQEEERRRRRWRRKRRTRLNAVGWRRRSAERMVSCRSVHTRYRTSRVSP